MIMRARPTETEFVFENQILESNKCRYFVVFILLFNIGV